MSSQLPMIHSHDGLALIPNQSETVTTKLHFNLSKHLYARRVISEAPRSRVLTKLCDA